MIKDNGDFHASALILGPQNTTVLIRDTRKDHPLWKFPGGKKKLIRPQGQGRRGETPIETLVREVQEETGLKLIEELIYHIRSEDRKRYNQHFFLAELPSFEGILELSDEYEEVEVFALSQLDRLSGFHGVYRQCYTGYMKPVITSLRAGQ